MTLRLVALMSLVLLLSLAAFGLLVAHYQDRVMAEVANTASAVGQATLLELQRGLPGRSETESVLAWSWSADGASAARDASAAGPATEERTMKRLQVVTQLQQLEAAGPGRAAAPGGGPARTALGAVFAPAERACLAALSEAGSGELRYEIRIDEVRTESDPLRGLVLTIPRVSAPGPGPAPAGPLAAGAEPPQALQFLRDEIRLPIPVRHYEELFAAMRARSLALFCGVFVVGAALTTGLAAHFTRPVRRLDAALRRMSEGDLDVSVDVRGRDEVARLSRAFNEMAGKLRAGRERGRELARREKLSALGRMAAGVAHDVRNPLHSIGLTLQHLSETARPREPQRAGEFDRSLEIIRGEIRRLGQLIDNFLRFARSERRGRVAVDLVELLRETARLVQKEAERRGVELRLELDPAVPSVSGDLESLRSAILNLVLNSFEAMPHGGRLTLALGVAERDVLLEVSDTGVGIADEDRERVFEFAYTTREAGHGLGLAMVHHCVVEEHGGRVTLASRRGEGTSVRLALPAGAGAAA